MKTYEPENIKITAGEWEITGFHKEKLIIKHKKGDSSGEYKEGL